MIGRLIDIIKGWFKKKPVYIARKKLIPKGCRVYDYWHNEQKIFSCIATSQKQADRKCKKFLINNA